MRDEKGHWIKGSSGNPKGKPRGSEGLAEYIRSKTNNLQDVADQMVTIAADPLRGPDQLAALKWLAERTVGKVPEQFEHSGNVNFTNEFEATLLKARTRVGLLN